jgi:hypothetical protein
MKKSSRVVAHRVAAVLFAVVLFRPPPARAQLVDPVPPDSMHVVECGACSAGQRVGLAPVVPAAVMPDTNRRHAIEYSPLYSTSMTVHRIASYLEIPLFVAEYAVGTQLYNYTGDKYSSDYQSIRNTHAALAGVLGALFITNTVTGVYGLYESRHDPAGRTRKWIHSISMLVADAGFVATAAAAESAREDPGGASTHRSIAIASMGVALASTIMMWFWKN